MKPQHHGIKRLLNATRYSIKGLRFAWNNESAFREEVIASFFLLLSGYFIAENSIEVILLVASIVLVLIVELLNSAIEAVVDRIGLEHHTLAGAAKDMGSAAVFVSLVLFIFTWMMMIIF